MTYTLHCGDCLDVLPTLAAGSVDAVITDPPYGLGKRWTGGTWFQRGVYNVPVTWDDNTADEAIRRIVSMNIPAIIWGGNYYELPPSRCWLAWNKVQLMPTMADFELAWTNFDKPSKAFSTLRNGWERQHPTEKPLDLMRWVIREYTRPGDVILDPFMGGGTTGVAALMEGRRFVGIEINPRYFRIAERRIANAQPPLFVADAPTMPTTEQASLLEVYA